LADDHLREDGGTSEDGGREVSAERARTRS
jgi:hypothetical protein